MVTTTFGSSWWTISAARAADQARQIASHAHGGRDVERRFGALRAQLEYAHVDELLEGGLLDFLGTTRERAWQAERALHGSFFHRDDRPVQGAGGPGMAPQQQQQ